MTRYSKQGPRRAPIGSTDVYSRKHIDRELDRLDRLRVHDKARVKAVEEAFKDMKVLLLNFISEHG